MLSNSLPLFIVSYLLLFSEIMAIRWLSAELVVLRTFPNLILMIIFISASIGILSRNKQKSTLLMVSLCCLTTVGLALFSHQLGFFNAGLKPDSLLTALTVIGFVTANLSITFAAIGRKLGTEFERLPALKAYSINLLGSILGTLSLSLYPSSICRLQFGWLFAEGVYIIYVAVSLFCL